MRQAKLLGLLLVKERRIPGRKSLTNVVSIVSKEWTGWLRIGPKLIGGRNAIAPDNHFHSKGEAPRGGGYRPHVRPSGGLDRLSEDAERRSAAS